MSEFNNLNNIVEIENLKLTKENRVKSFAQLVGINLRKARKEQRITSTFAADKLDLDKTQISHFEAGRRIPSLLVFQKLCFLYKAEPQNILAINVTEIGGKLVHDFDLSNSGKVPHRKKDATSKSHIGVQEPSLA